MNSMASVRQPSQNRIMRAVRGAVKNASDAHPNWRLDRRFVNSVAKRAAGTLTAEWPEVLAARLARRQERRNDELDRALRRRDGFKVPTRSPLKLLWKRLSNEVGEAKRAGRIARAAVLIDVLRIIAEMQKSSQGEDHDGR